MPREVIPSDIFKQNVQNNALPYLLYNFGGGSAVVYDNKIHTLGGSDNNYKKHYSYSFNGTEWTEESTLPYNFTGGSVVVYDGKIHILGGSSSGIPTGHYSWDGTEWTEESTLPYSLYGGSAVVYDGKIHILGGNYSSSYYKKHYSWDGTEWVSESTLPYNFYYGSAVVYDNKIHILGGSGNTTKHYSWDGTEWVSESTLPYNFYYGSAVVYNNEIHILGSNYSGSRTNHYFWDGTEWTYSLILPYEFVDGSAVVYDNKIHILSGRNHYFWNGLEEWVSESTLSYDFNYGSAVVYDNKIHILGGGSTYTNHYSWNGTEWTEESTLPYNFYYGSAVVYNNKIHILGSSNTGNYTKHYSWDGTEWTEESTLPTNFYNGSAVVYDGKIHILGGPGTTYYQGHYSWNGTSWTSEMSTPSSFYYGSAVVYDNKIHILGCGSSDLSARHYSWNGTEWTREDDLPYSFIRGSAVVYDNKIHILGSNHQGDYTKHCSWNGIEWISESTLPYNFSTGSAIVYDNKIYILGSISNPRKMYGFETGIIKAEWIESLSLAFIFTYGASILFNDDLYILVCNYMKKYKKEQDAWETNCVLPYYFYNGSAVVYDGKIHILGSYHNDNNTKKHYSWDGTEWTEESILPYSFYAGSAVVYNNKIHILGSDNSSNYTRHYSWDGTSWTQESTLPYEFNHGYAVVCNNKIHILGTSYGNNQTKHYSWNGTSWTEESTLPYDFYYGSAVVYSNKIHILGSSSYGNYTKHYSYDGSQWTEEFILPYNFYGGSAVVYDNKINILGGSNNDNPTKHYSLEYYLNTNVNKIDFGDENLINLTEDTITSDQLKQNLIAHDKAGNFIKGTRPIYYKENSSKYALICQQELWSEEGVDKPALYLGGQIIKLRVPSGTNNLQLVAMKSDGVTESVVTIHTLTTGFRDKACLRRVRYISDAMCLIEYYAYTSAIARSAIQFRCILIKADGTLVMPAASGWGAATTATSYSDAWWCRALWKKPISTFTVDMVMNTTSGAIRWRGYRSYTTMTTGGLSYASTIVMGHKSCYYANTIIPDQNIAPSVGGWFYKFNNTDYLCTYTNYSSTGKVTSMANIGEDMANVGVAGHHMLGMLRNGLIVTIKEDDKIYVWSYDQSSTTNMYTLINSYNFPDFGVEYEVMLKNLPVTGYFADNTGASAYPVTISSESRTAFIGYNLATQKTYYNDIDGTQQWTLLSQSVKPTARITNWIKCDGTLYAIPENFDDTWVYTWEANNYSKQVHDDSVSATFTVKPGNAFSRQYDSRPIIFAYNNEAEHYSFYRWGGTASGWQLLGGVIPNTFNDNNNYFIIYKNKIHYLSETYHYSNSSISSTSSWTQLNNLPFNFSRSLYSVVIQGDKIHVLGNGKEHYTYDNTSWTREEDLPIEYYGEYGSAIEHDQHIYLIYSNQQPLNFYKLKNNSLGKNKVKVLCFSNDVIIFSDGRRYQVTPSELIQLPTLELQYAQCPTNRNQIGPESEPWDGVFIYGD